MTGKKKSGPSGAHTSPRRLLSQSPEEWAKQDAKAAKQGKAWAEWAREALEKAARV